MRVGGKTLTETLRGLPVVGSAASLMVGTVATSLLGLPFWILAAQLYSGASLGVASTGVNLTMILAEVACLGLRSGLARYIPRADTAAPKTVLFGYVVGTTAAAVALAVFLIGFPLWGSNLGAMRASPGVALYVILAGACWALFMLQDSVLVALGKSAWVPIENTIFGLVKLALLFPFASWSPEFGIYWAWTLPVIPLVLIVNSLIAREFLRKEPQPTEEREPETASVAEPASSGRLGPAPGRSFLSELVAFSLADWRSSLARLAGIVVISLLVIDRLGQVASAYFQIAWTMAYALFSLSATAAFALLVDRRGDRQTLSRNSMQVGALCLAVTGLASLIGVLSAPLILRLFGPEFSDNASTLMRLLFLAALPNVVFQMYLGYLRTQGRMRKLITVETIVSLTAVLLTAALIGRLGINGVGWAWLVSVLAVSLYAGLSESVWWWASWLDTGIVRRIGNLARRIGFAGPRSRKAELSEALRLVAGPDAERATWESTGAAAAAVIVDRDRTERMYRLASDETGVAELDAEEATIVHLRSLTVEFGEATPGAAPWSDLLPELVDRTRDNGASSSVWRRPSGRSAAELIEQGWSPAAVVDAVLPIIQSLHESTVQRVEVDQHLLARWTEPALQRLGQVETVTEEALDGVRHLLRDELIGFELEVGTVHGRLTANNIVLGPDPATVVGLRGWRSLDGARPLFLDRAVLAVSEMARQRRAEVGDLLRQLLIDPQPLVEHPGSPIGPDNRVPVRSVLLLTWLYILDFPHHERAALVPEFLWMARNARPVLDTVTDLRAAQATVEESESRLGTPSRTSGAPS